MKIRHDDIEIPSGNPFANCKLNRERYAEILTEIVGSYSDGFVLAINNEWGTGKTTFVRMWRQHLSNAGFQTIYFNAWESDFNNDPLVALVSELNPLIKGKVDREKIYRSVIEKGAVLAKNVMPVVAKSLIKKYVIDTELVDEAVENATRGATEILSEEIKEYSEKKKSIVDFRTELEKFVDKTSGDRQLVFIIDELDRCRPNYAVEVLEQLKHFFAVKGIVFVLSIDKRHLASSVKGFYGSNEINTEEYLRRFIDLEYSIPRPPSKIFCRYLFEYYKLGDFFHSEERRKYRPLRSDADSLLNMAELLFEETHATLRQQERIFSQTRLIVGTFKHNQYTFAHLLFIMIFIKTMRNEFYEEILGNTLTLQQLSDHFCENLPLGGRNQYSANVGFALALLLHFYNNNQREQRKISLLDGDNYDNWSTPIELKQAPFDNRELASHFAFISQQWEYSDVPLKYLLDRINLVEPIITN